MDKKHVLSKYTLGIAIHVELSLPKLEPIIKNNIHFDAPTKFLSYVQLPNIILEDPSKVKCHHDYFTLYSMKCV